MLFVSHASDDTLLVQALVSDLRSLQDVWLDHELSGGDAWWTEILEHIRDCDVFVFAVSPESLTSAACAAELDYAADLGKPVLPVEIVDVGDARRNHQIFSSQTVDYRAPDKDSFRTLVAAVRKAGQSTKPLPDPLPVAPAIPYGYLMTLGSRVHEPSDISRDDQRRMLEQLRDRLHFDRSASVRANIRDILVSLRDRPDTTRQIASEIDETLRTMSVEPVDEEPFVVEDPVIVVDDSPSIGGEEPVTVVDSPAPPVVVRSPARADAETPSASADPGPVASSVDIPASDESLPVPPATPALELPPPTGVISAEPWTTVAPQHPAGWYPDQTDPRRVRWWDGNRWTEYTEQRRPDAGGERRRPAGSTMSILAFVFSALSLIPYVYLFCIAPAIVFAIIARIRREKLGTAALVTALGCLVIGFVILVVVALAYSSTTR